jgi:hypothetical protein
MSLPGRFSDTPDKFALQKGTRQSPTSNSRKMNQLFSPQAIADPQLGPGQVRIRLLHAVTYDILSNSHARSIGPWSRASYYSLVWHILTLPGL